MADEQYDKLIKRMQSSDEHQQPEMPAAAWEKMQAKLDDEFGNQKKRRRFFWLFLLVPLLLVGVWFSSMLGVKPDPKSNVSEVQKIRPSALETKNPNESIAAKTKSNSNTQPATFSEQSDLSKKNKPTTGDHFKTSNSSTSNSLKRTDEDTQWQSHDSPLQSRSHRKKGSHNKTETSSSLTTMSIHAILPSTTKQSAIEKQGDAPLVATRPFTPTVDAKPHQFPPDSFHLSNQLTLDQPALKLVFPNAVQKAKSSTKSPPRFFLGVSGMYTSSGVSLSRIGQGTSGYGFQLGLLWKRFSLTTGLNAGNVVYSARGDEYKLGKDYNPYGYALQNVDAKCYILDIPVIANYIFPTKKRTGFFAGLGVASQLMKRENYDYTSVLNTMTWKGTWSYKNKNKHFLSLLQIDAGINHRFSKNLFLQASPFFRTPLKGIGEGSVHLRTVGLQASLNFFPFSAKNN